MTRKQRLIRMILSKRLKKYGRGMPQTVRKPINFAGLRALLQAQNSGISEKDKPSQSLEAAQDSQSND